MNRSTPIFFAAAVLVVLSHTGCFAVVPLIQPDEQAVNYGKPPEQPQVFYTPAPSTTKVRYTRFVPNRVPDLISQLQDKKPVVVINAASRLGDMGPVARPAVPALIATLHHEHYWARRAAAKALGKLRAREAIPGLTLAMQDRDKYVAASAANALRAIQN